MKEGVSLVNIAGGALQEQFERCLEEVRESYHDDTRDMKAKREIKLTLTFSRRETGLVEVTTESTVKLPSTKGAMGFLSEEIGGYEAVDLPRAKQSEMFDVRPNLTAIGGSGKED